MPIPITTPAEAVLQLVSEYQGLESKGPPVRLLWRLFGNFLQSEMLNAFHGYRLAGIDPQALNTEFLGDIKDLKSDLLIELDADRVSLTPLGRVLTIARELPPELKKLGARMEKHRLVISELDKILDKFLMMEGRTISGAELRVEVIRGTSLGERLLATDQRMRELLNQ
jgi:hypothetical protein